MIKLNRLPIWGLVIVTGAVTVSYAVVATAAFYFGFKVWWLDAIATLSLVALIVICKEEKNA